jgi:hypothetical protein
MDSAALNPLVVNADDRQFWIVLWGEPDHSPEEDTQVFNESHYDHGFAVNPAAMKLGDILFVHRIHISKIIFVAEIVASPRRSTEEEKRKESWRQRWQWSIETKNLTPTYGTYWKRYAVKPFDLAKEYNKANAHDKVNLGRMNFGNYVRISQGFAKFLLNEIIGLRL